MRRIIEINNDWKFVKMAAGLQDAMKSEGTPVSLPHTWNAIDGIDGGNDYYRGTCWYVKNLSIPEKENADRVYLEFNGAAHTADIYLNEKHLFHHEGGYSTFRVDITESIEDVNTLCVSLDNKNNKTVYPQTADFTFYGGLYRSVNLITVPSTHFDLDYFGRKGIKVTPKINGKDANVEVEIFTKGEDSNAYITIGNVSKPVMTKNGYAKENFLIENVHLWDGLNDPFLYKASASLESGDSVETKFGCRTFEIDADKGFILNRREYPLRGVSRHQDRIGVGNALTLDMHKEDMALIEEIGANTIRLAHYQHSQEFYDLCDEKGMIIWAEIPYITMHMKDARENTISQMKELVIQNYNHASIVVWGLSNEISAASKVDEDLLENHRILNDLCHSLDKTRLTTAAHAFMLETDSPIIDIADVNSYNLYYGWYLGELEQNEEFFDEFHEKYPNKPIGFSEYGADANPQYQSSNPSRGDYSETYQALYHEHCINMINKRPFMWATHVWNMFDFAADGRDEGGKHGINQKGLVTIDRKIKKDAFYLYKAHWNKKEKFVHIAGRRYIERAEDVTKIKVYSNENEVTLYVNGEKLEKKAGNAVFEFTVNLESKTKIEAVTESSKDSIEIIKVEKPNPDYSMTGDANIVNWFDKEDFNAEYYSISDTLGDLSKSPEANAIVQGLMGQTSAARGDVAEMVKDNPNLVRMMQRTTLISMLKQVSDLVSNEQIEALNKMLQKIKK